MATKANKSQIEDAVGGSLAALAVEEDPQGRGIRTLQVGWERGGWERGGRAGGVLDSENTGRIRSQTSLIGRLS